jgi:rare lipoprotein A
MIAIAGAVATLGFAQVTEASPEAMERRASCPDVADYTEEGLASWYGKVHHGRRTASGAIFDEGKLTVAHRWLPFGTKLAVSNLANGRTVTMIVTDRGPYIKGRFLDVSRRAASDLGFLRAGVVRVRAKVVDTCS